MKGQKDIFDHIKDNQHKLDERPPRELWDRLENRLDEADQKAKPVRRTLYRRLTLVAAVVGLAGLFSLVSLLLQNNNDKNMATAESFDTPKQWEDLSAEDHEKGWHKYADFQRRINMRPSITEGAPHKKLVAQRDFSVKKEDNRFAENTAKTNNRASDDKTTSPPIASSIETRNDANVSSASVSEPVTNGQDASIAMAKTQVESYDITMEEEAAVDASSVGANTPVPSEAEVHKAEARKRAIREAKEEAYAAAKKKSSARRPVAKAKAKEYAKDAMDALQSSKNKIEVDGIAQVGLNQFRWLLGQWTANEQHASIESWKMVDEFTIAGKGFLVVNGDTTFTEGMTIQKIDQDLYYILALDQSGTNVKYKLKTYTEQEAVFENTKVAFPNQVILRKGNGANYSTILQNTSPAQINEKQQQYFQNRNIIRQEQVKRVMKRMK